MRMRHILSLAVLGLLLAGCGGGPSGGSAGGGSGAGVPTSDIVTLAERMIDEDTTDDGTPWPVDELAVVSAPEDADALDL